MKILHIIDHSLPLHSGYAFRSHNIFREQRKRGWDPVILTSPKHEQSWKGHWASQEQIEGFTHHRTGAVSGSWVPVREECQLMRALTRRIAAVAKLEKPDILHAHSPVLNAMPALFVRHRFKIPLVYEIRAFWEDAGVDQGTYTENSLKYRVVRSLETWMCRKADHVVVLCEGLKQDLIERGIPVEKITVVYNGINTDDFSSNDPDDEFKKAWKLDGKRVIGFIGSFYHYEGLDLLLQAFSRLAARQKDILLLLVGGGEMESKLRTQIRQLHVEEKVIMPGRIPHDRIAGVYALVDILAYPRYSMRLTELVTPLKPLEAMAMGKALVASDVGGHQELIWHGETGLLFPAGDSKALAASLQELIKDDALRQRLECHGPTWVRKHHTWGKTTSVYQDIYAKALSKVFV